MANILKRDRSREKEIENAANNRREIIAARLSRREMMARGLLTSAGMLIPKRGLSARWRDAQGRIPLDNPQSPFTTPWVEEMPIMPVKQPVSSLTPRPIECPNAAAGEARTRCHQVFSRFPPRKLYEVHQREGRVIIHRELPPQIIWGFDGISPGPTYVARYGEPILVRNFNDLPAVNGGFGHPSVTTHLHNGHTPSESDGNPCDYFGRGRFYDHHYPNLLAGFASSHPPTGDIREALSTLWYHDHRMDFTSQNVYKGLAGFYLLFNEFDTGDERAGFRLPGFPDFDIPMMFSDKLFDSDGRLFYDLHNRDGILGDKFLVNGKIQPVLHVHPRRYRFRWLDSGPSRFYEFFLTDLKDLGARNRFWQITSDGNLLPKPLLVESVRLGPGERADVIIDFAGLHGKTIYLENRLEQTRGRGHKNRLLPPGQGNLVLQIKVDLPRVREGSVSPADVARFYELPPQP